jgi:signal transduction histidine kinase
LKLNKELFILSDLISHIIEDYKDELDNENVKLIPKFIYCNLNVKKTKKEKRKNKYKLSIFADRNRINQVISNLSINAVKFTNTDTIDIIIEKQDSEIMYS